MTHKLLYIDKKTGQPVYGSTLNLAPDGAFDKAAEDVTLVMNTQTGKIWADVWATMPEDELRRNYDSWYPHGSGPLGAMRTICGLILTVARLRGIDTSRWMQL
jgi:hypothetical protein